MLYKLFIAQIILTYLFIAMHILIHPNHAKLYQREAWERPSRPFSWDRQNLHTLASHISILATMVLSSYNVDKIIVLNVTDAKWQMELTLGNSRVLQAIDGGHIASSTLSGGLRSVHLCACRSCFSVQVTLCDFFLNNKTLSLHASFLKIHRDWSFQSCKCKL